QHRVARNLLDVVRAEGLRTAAGEKLHVGIAGTVRVDLENVEEHGIGEAFLVAAGLLELVVEARGPLDVSQVIAEPETPLRVGKLDLVGSHLGAVAASPSYGPRQP